MPAKKKVFCVEISDILDPDQEDSVIEIVKGYLKKDNETLKDYFEQTDTIEVRRLSEEEVKKLSERLKSVNDISVKVYDLDEKKVEKESNVVRCPKCGFTLEFADWRCPECFYEFPDFELSGDEGEDEDEGDDEDEGNEE
jgi:rubrerythrin